LVTVAIGALLMLVGSLVHGDYARGVWSDLGTAVVLFGPLYGLQWMLERGMSEVRRHAQETRSSVEHLSHEIEAIRQQTAASLDDLRNVTLHSVQQLRASDEDAFRRFKEGPTFETSRG